MSASAFEQCHRCGAVMSDEDRFCTECGAAAGFRPPVGAAGAAPDGDSSPYRAVSGIGVTPTARFAGMEGIALAHREVVKRVYELGRVERLAGSAQGTLVVTDARVLYHARAKNVLNASTVNHEIHLKDVRGVGLVTRKGMSAAGFGMWLLGSAVVFGLFVTLGVSFDAAVRVDAYFSGQEAGPPYWLIVMVLIWLVACLGVFLLRRRASVVVLTVFANDVAASPISVSGVVGRAGGRGRFAFLAAPLAFVLERLGVIEAGAAAEAAHLDSMRAVYAELGAVILDLQSRGSLGVD